MCHAHQAALVLSLREERRYLHPRDITRCLDFPFGFKVHLGPIPNFPLPFELAILLASFPVDKFLPTDLQAIVLKVDHLAILGVCESQRLAKHDLRAFILTGRDDLANDEVCDRELVLVVDGDLGCICSRVGDLGEGPSS